MIPFYSSKDRNSKVRDGSGLAWSRWTLGVKNCFNFHESNWWCNSRWVASWGWDALELGSPTHPFGSITPMSTCNNFLEYHHGCSILNSKGQIPSKTFGPSILREDNGTPWILKCFNAHTRFSWSTFYPLLNVVPKGIVINYVQLTFTNIQYFGKHLDMWWTWELCVKSPKRRQIHEFDPSLGVFSIKNFPISCVSRAYFENWVELLGPPLAMLIQQG